MDKVSCILHDNISRFNLRHLKQNCLSEPQNFLKKRFQGYRAFNYYGK